MWTSLVELAGDNTFFIESASDLPNFAWSEHFRIPVEISRHGKESMMSYFQAFDRQDGAFYIQFFPSGFPDGKLPEF